MWRVGGCPSPHVILWMRYEVMLSVKNEVMRYHQWFYQTLDRCMRLFQVLIYLCADHRYLWFAGCFVKQCAFQSEANIQQSDHASADFDIRTIIMVVWCPVFLMSGQNSWWWTSNNCDIVICHIEMTIILTRTLWGCFSGWGPLWGYYQLSLSDNHNHWPGHKILT